MSFQKEKPAVPARSESLSCTLCLFCRVGYISSVYIHVPLTPSPPASQYGPSYCGTLRVPSCSHRFICSSDSATSNQLANIVPVSLGVTILTGPRLDIKWRIFLLPVVGAACSAVGSSLACSLGLDLYSVSIVPDPPGGVSWRSAQLVVARLS